MANRYWIGGTGNWTDTAHWSDAQNGAGGFSAPTLADNVFFTANSGTGTITVNAVASMADFDVTSLAANITLDNAAYAFNVYGNLKLSNYLLPSFTGTGYLYLKSTTSVGIWTNGTTKNWNIIYFDGVGGTWTNQDDWNAGTSEIYLTNGTWNQSTYNVSCKSFDYGVGTATLTMVSGIFSTYEGCFFHINSANKTFNCGTGTIKNTSTTSSENLYVGANTFYDVEAYGISSGNPSGLCTFRNLTATGTATGSNSINLSEGNPSWVITGTFTVNGYNAAERRILIYGLIGTPRTITCNGTIVASNVDFRDITGAGTANWDLSEITGGSGDAGGNSGIIFTPSQTLYFKHTSGAVNLSDSSKWFTTDGGSTLGRTPLPQDYAYFTANSFAGTSTITFNMPRFCGFDMSGVNQAVTLSQNMTIGFYGDYILGNNIITSLDYLSNISLSGKSGVESKFNSYAKSLGASRLYINQNTYRNYSDISMGTANTSQFRMGNAVFYLNGYNLSCYLFNLLSNTSGYFGGYFYAGSGTITINGSEFGIYRIRFIAETSTIVMNSSGTADITISIGSLFGSLVTINKLILQGTITGNYIIGQNVGSTIINELTINAGKKVKFEGGRTFMVGKLTNNGESGNLTTIGSTTTTKANIVLPTVQNIDYANISYINVTQANKLFAGLNSVDGGNNTNVVFGRAELVCPQFTDAEVIESTLLGHAHAPAQFAEPEALGAALRANAGIVAALAEPEELNASLLAKVFTQIDFTEAEELYSLLTARAGAIADFLESELSATEMVSQALAEAAFAEADSLASQLIAKAMLTISLTEDEQTSGEVLAAAVLEAAFTEAEKLFVRNYEKITGISTFTKLIAGKSVFTWVIKGTSNFK